MRGIVYQEIEQNESKYSKKKKKRQSDRKYNHRGIKTSIMRRNKTYLIVLLEYIKTMKHNNEK